MMKLKRTAIMLLAMAMLLALAACGNGDRNNKNRQRPATLDEVEAAIGEQLDNINTILDAHVEDWKHVLEQHSDLARLHPPSVNTLRILTDLVGDTVHIAYVTLKMGRGGCHCDNSGQGGILCRVDVESGKICSLPTDDYFNVYACHPDTDVAFLGYQLPMVAEAVDLAKKAAREIPQIRHIGWDIAITPQGPAIIEGNEFPGTDLCQLAPFCPEKKGLWPYYKRILQLGR